ncbi:MAG: transposase [Fimbriimonadia bacterium]|jgi:REP element-mobilizing transposase RayT
MRYRHWLNVGQGDETVFVTTGVLGFTPVFRRSELADAMLNSLADDCLHLGVTLHAYVVMPEHLHLLARLPPGRTAASVMRSMKSRSAAILLPMCRQEMDSLQPSVHGRRAFWQEGFRSVPVYSEDDAIVKVAYIHNNPVKRGLVRSAEEYRWSSAWLFEQGSWCEETGLPLDQVLARHQRC